MRKFTRNLTLAVILAATCGIGAHADIPTGTDPVPPHKASGTTTSIIETVVEVLTGIVL